MGVREIIHARQDLRHRWVVPVAQELGLSMGLIQNKLCKD